MYIRGIEHVVYCKCCMIEVQKQRLVRSGRITDGLSRLENQVLQSAVWPAVELFLDFGLSFQMSTLAFIHRLGITTGFLSQKTLLIFSVSRSILRPSRTQGVISLERIYTTKPLTIFKILTSPFGSGPTWTHLKFFLSLWQWTCLILASHARKRSQLFGSSAEKALFSSSVGSVVVSWLLVSRCGFWLFWS